MNLNVQNCEILTRKIKLNSTNKKCAQLALQSFQQLSPPSVDSAATHTMAHKKRNQYMLMFHQTSLRFQVIAGDIVTEEADHLEDQSDILLTLATIHTERVMLMQLSQWMKQ